MSAENDSQWEQLWLPLWPLASDDLRRGIYRESRADALQRRYIEANPKALSNLLVVDIDHSDARLRVQWERQGWYPNALVENPSNGHAHAVWALQEPITRTSYAKRKPLAFAAAVTEGLRRSVDGDKGYSGLMTKNPDHAAWDAHWMTDRLYSLRELQERLEDIGSMPPPSWKRTRRRNPVGLGRNCDIFESARTWAYRLARQIRQRHEHATDEDSRDLLAGIAEHVTELNISYTEPLPNSETRSISKSIHGWITTHFDGWIDSRLVSTATFSTIQSARGHKSGQSRRTAHSKANRQTILEALNDE